MLELGKKPYLKNVELVGVVSDTLKNILYMVPSEKGRLIIRMLKQKYGEPTYKKEGRYIWVLDNGVVEVIYGTGFEPVYVIIADDETAKYMIKDVISRTHGTKGRYVVWDERTFSWVDAETGEVLGERPIMDTDFYNIVKVHDKGKGKVLKLEYTPFSLNIIKAKAYSRAINMPKEIRKQIVNEYLKGVPVNDIINKYGLQYSKTLYYILSIEGINVQRRRKRKRKITEEEKQQIIREYKSGKLVSDIMREHNISTATLYKIVKPKRKHHHRRKYSHEEVQKIVEMYKQGKSIYSISRELGIPVSTVYYILKRHGLKQ